MILSVDSGSAFRIAQLRAFLLGVAYARGTVPFVHVVCNGVTANDLRATLLAEVAEGRPMLTAIVTSRSTGLPPQGFFQIAKNLGRYVDDVSPGAFWASELDRVYEAYGKSLPAQAPPAAVAPTERAPAAADVTDDDDGEEPDVAGISPA